MEAATSLPFTRVRTRGSELVIDGLRVADETVVRLAREREQAGESAEALVVDALEIGARVLDREHSAANAEFVRAEFERAARELAQNAHAQLDEHESERRRALHDLGERLRQRERELREWVEAEETGATQRIRAGFNELERRQVDQLKRVVDRTAANFAEAVSRQFDGAIRNSRDEAARRLTRELDRAVEHFAREAQRILAERLARVADAGGQRLERRLSQIGAALEEERNELVAELQRRVGGTELELRRQIQALATDAEAERTVMHARLQELRRRIDETLAEAESRTASTFRGG
jgi:hypothetical protein